MKKITEERDELSKLLKQTRERMDEEIRKRERTQIELNQYKKDSRVGRDV